MIEKGEAFWHEILYIAYSEIALFFWNRQTQRVFVEKKDTNFVMKVFVVKMVIAEICKSPHVVEIRDIFRIEIL